MLARPRRNQATVPDFCGSGFSQIHSRQHQTAGPTFHMNSGVRISRPTKHRRAWVVTYNDVDRALEEEEAVSCHGDPDMLRSECIASYPGERFAAHVRLLSPSAVRRSRPTGMLDREEASGSSGRARDPSRDGPEGEEANRRVGCAQRRAIQGASMLNRLRASRESASIR
ncbi:hypothetical protein VTO42DRAFT_110 [Malbranchea cinnamomea]